MPFIPHTSQDIKTMLDAINIADRNKLFDEIPAHILFNPENFKHIPESMNEIDLMRRMKTRAQQDQADLNFIGAGAYEHHIPAAVWDITTRGEFMTAYTPYQAEASQGTLQLLYEYQTMMANLTGMEVSNASLYDGASALAEAVLMAVRLKKTACPIILMPKSVHPLYRQTVKSIIKNQAIQLIDIEINQKTGQTDINILENIKKKYSTITALVIPQPNFFGILEDCDALTDFAHAQDALVIGVVNPMSLALLKEPGKWGETGADIVCGELQPFGIPLASGGPYAGFLCTRLAYIRQMPGRIAGATTDKNHQRGFTLTLQAREQHIRRGKAVSNICTNQGLLVTAATVYLSLLGFEGLKRIAAQCHANTAYLFESLNPVSPFDYHKFNISFFHEIIVKFDSPVNIILDKLAKQNILAGYPLERDYPEIALFKNCLLICATETKSREDLDRYLAALKKETT